MLNFESQKRNGLSALHLTLEMYDQELHTGSRVALQVIWPQLRLVSVFRVHFDSRIENAFVTHSVFEHRKRDGNAISFLI